MHEQVKMEDRRLILEMAFVFSRLFLRNIKKKVLELQKKNQKHLNKSILCLL